MKRSILSSFIGLTLMTGVAQAELDHVPEAIRDLLKTMRPGTEIARIENSLIAGFYEVTIDANVYYISGDGRYLLDGDLIDMNEGKNLTESLRSDARKNVIAGVDEATMIVFSPKQVKHTVTVFTDIDCGYCRKLHREIDQYNAIGIEIRYLAFPRAGRGSGSYKKAISVWCADDRNQALTDAKMSRELETKSCDHPVDDQMAIGKKLRVAGTPYMILEDGRMLPGYLSADKLLREIRQ